MDKLLVKNARVYQDGQFARADVLCEDALIAKIGENLTDDDARIIDAGGMRLAPGFIDVHTHGAAARSCARWALSRRKSRKRI